MIPVRNDLPIIRRLHESGDRAQIRENGKLVFDRLRLEDPDWWEFIKRLGGDKRLWDKKAGDPKNRLAIRFYCSATVDAYYPRSDYRMKNYRTLTPSDRMPIVQQT